MIYDCDHETDVCDWRVVTIRLSVWSKEAVIAVDCPVLCKNALKLIVTETVIIVLWPKHLLHDKVDVRPISKPCFNTAIGFEFAVLFLLS
jgi:hypothetical protein